MLLHRHPQVEMQGAPRFGQLQHHLRATPPPRCQSSFLRSDRLLLLPVAILHDDNQPNALRNSHRAMRNPHTRPYARNTRRAHHPGSTGDSVEIEGAI